MYIKKNKEQKLKQKIQELIKLNPNFFLKNVKQSLPKCI